ncbi:porin [Flavihumibacter petaseus]|uniref:Porin n=1 Tax=Flavihumibacter petaseus NBRC 106054 TaxID=1220578 RepID=A0A0E9MUC4_9BACT|nr:porin [Flavihumibacter petaseus]GAO41016.1 hypothetical protein FPE01S_01_00280 [Flavihumibacter petaseus NBRC 106054]
MKKKIKLRSLAFLSLLLCKSPVQAQDTTASTAPAPTLQFSGYAEAYYSYDFNEPADHNKATFLYSHSRHNEFNLNLGYLKAAYSAARIRANLALAAGTYMNANYAAETGVLKNIFEANAGVRLGRKQLWLDAGIFGSHIGFESAISKDCWTLTRSILAENSPYYEAGAKLTYSTDNGKWLMSVLALNGWQRITRVDGNSMMSWGTQLQYKPSGNVLLNYSTFLGTDKPDTARLLRVFHNVYGTFQLSEKWGLTTGFDIGTEEKTPSADGTNLWYSPVVIVRFAVNKKWTVAARAEYYNDKDGVIISTETPNGFQTSGYSLNIDYSPVQNALIRLEGRNLRNKDDSFAGKDGPSNNDSFITASIAISF